jgi:hypothetical protein
MTESQKSKIKSVFPKVAPTQSMNHDEIQKKLKDAGVPSAEVDRLNTDEKARKAAKQLAEAA